MVLITATLLILVGCKVRIPVPEGGKVEAKSGSYRCNGGQMCTIEVVDLFFDETFQALPADGYYFSHWEKGNRRLCGGRRQPCRLVTAGFEGNDALMAILESDKTFVLKPLFLKTVDTPCGPYPDPRTSPYILPYKIGTSSRLHQGNCAISHREGTPAQFAYDFIMEIGTEVIAMRSGVVRLVEERHADHLGRGFTNYMSIVHEDKTEAYYMHITQNGALVSSGQFVEQGQVVALAGHSGSISPVHHLHAVVYDPKAEVSIPFTFRNIQPRGTAWLLPGQRYKALQYK